MERAVIDEENICSNCFNASQMTGIPEEEVGYGYYCPNEHFKCLNCASVTLHFPTTYRDFTGRDYLVCQPRASHLPECLHGHPTMLHKHHPSQSWEFTCWKCLESKFFDNEHGVAECSTCKSYLCSKCMGARMLSFEESKSDVQLAVHFAESSAEEIPFCNCHRPFKKVYRSRVLNTEEWQNTYSKVWECQICETEKQEGELHLACFSCPHIFAMTGRKLNIQICIDCADRSKMTLLSPKKEAKEIECLIACPNDRVPLLLTSRLKEEAIFKCLYCRGKYFGHT
jgi:hypothetical protein